jgi:hypothetical protein
LGGPLFRDRLWFFGSYRYLYRNSQVSRTPDQLRNILALVPDWQPFDNRSRHGTGFFKVNTRLTARHQLNGFLLNLPGREEQNQAPNLKRFGASAYSGTGAAARLYSAWTNSLTTTAGASFNNVAANSSLAAFKGLDYGGPNILLYNSANASAGRLVGNGLLVTTGNSQSLPVAPANKLTIQGDLNWFKAGWLGSHEFQAGVLLQPMLRLSQTTHYLNNGFILEESRLRIAGDLASGYVPFHRRYVDPTQLVVTTAKSNSADYGVYVQDSWKPVTRLTLVAGLRLDRVIAKDELFDVQTQSSLSRSRMNCWSVIAANCQVKSASTPRSSDGRTGTFRRRWTSTASTAAGCSGAMKTSPKTRSCCKPTTRGIRPSTRAGSSSARSARVVHSSSSGTRGHFSISAARGSRMIRRCSFSRARLPTTAALAAFAATRTTACLARH